MKRISFITLTILLLCLFVSGVSASCTDEELATIKNDIKKIKISYKHLGEVIKEDGSIVYNEFKVTARNMPSDVYVYLSPMTKDKFVRTEDVLTITLTTGEWEYNLYSSKCEKIVDNITVKLPTFNVYSLDPLCDGIDGNEFRLCGKYYEGNVSREEFLQRVNNYKLIQTKEKKDDVVEEENSILDDIIEYVENNYIYIVAAIIVIILFILIFNILSKKKNKKVLQ